jgi:hypothetical protein
MVLKPSASNDAQSWKTGMRVPVDGFYQDQYAYVSYHEAHHTFPPCIDRKGECAIRKLISQ